MRNMALVRAVTVCVFMAYAGAVLAAGVDLAAAEKLIRSGHAAEAYKELSRLEFQNAGKPAFDYLLGLAALQSGHPDLATLAFERVLVVQPNHMGARLDMARAHYMLGDYALAKREFEALKTRNPPPPARRAIAHYLAAIKERTTPTKWSAYLEVGGGYDSNANNATSNQSVFIPALGASVQLSASSTRRHSWFLDTRGGAEGSVKVTRAFSLNGGVDGAMRNYATESNLDTRDYGSHVGFDVADGADDYGATLRFSRNDLDYRSYRYIESVQTMWRHAVDQRTQVALFGQVNGIRYAQVNSENSNMLLAGAGWMHDMGDPAHTLLTASIFGGEDYARNNRADGNRSILGVRVGAQRKVLAHAVAYATAGMQVSRYARTNTLFADKRYDRYYDAAVGLQWTFLPMWSLRPQVKWSYNDSNLSIDSYRRTEIGLSVRRSFD